MLWGCRGVRFGTGELKGISSTFAIIIAAGKHSYDIDTSCLPKRPDFQLRS